MRRIYVLDSYFNYFLELPQVIEITKQPLQLMVVFVGKDLNIKIEQFISLRKQQSFVLQKLFFEMILRAYHKFCNIWEVPRLLICVWFSSGLIGNIYKPDITFLGAKAPLGIVSVSQ